MPQFRLSFGPTRQFPAPQAPADPALAAASASTQTQAAPTIPGIPTVNIGTPAQPNLQFLQQLQTGNNGWPVFRNDAERTIAINSGQYDPNYSTPLQKALAVSIGNDRQATQDALIAHQQAANPLASAKTPADVLAAQLAGDRDGTIKKIVLSNQPIPYNNDPNQLGPIDGAKPYTGTVGPNEHSVDRVAPLDYGLISHPEFAKKYQENPVEGARIYQAITGRPMKNDIEATHAFVDRAIKSEQDMFERNRANGAKRNADGTWMLRQEPAVDESQPVIQGMSQRPTRSEFRAASPMENAVMERQFKAYVPGGTAPGPAFTSSTIRNAQLRLQSLQNDAGFHKLLMDRKTMNGGADLTPIDQIRAANEYDDLKATQELEAHPTSILGFDVGPNTMKGQIKAHEFMKMMLQGLGSLSN